MDVGPQSYRDSSEGRPAAAPPPSRGRTRAVLSGTAALTAVVGVLCVVGVATAYFSTSGSGSGSATVGSALPVTIAAGAAPTAELYPGGAGDVTVRISNPNAFGVHVGSLALDTSHGQDGFDASPPGCNVGEALEFTTQTNGGAGWNVPANGTLDLDLAGSLHMTDTAANACQAATFTVYLGAGP